MPPSVYPRPLQTLIDLIWSHLSSLLLPFIYFFSLLLLLLIFVVVFLMHSIIITIIMIAVIISRITTIKQQQNLIEKSPQRSIEHMSFLGKSEPFNIANATFNNINKQPSNYPTCNNINSNIH